MINVWNCATICIYICANRKRRGCQSKQSQMSISLSDRSNFKGEIGSFNNEFASIYLDVLYFETNGGNLTCDTAQCWKSLKLVYYFLFSQFRKTSKGRNCKDFGSTRDSMRVWSDWVNIRVWNRVDRVVVDRVRCLFVDGNLGSALGNSRRICFECPKSVCWLSPLTTGNEIIGNVYH